MTFLFKALLKCGMCGAIQAYRRPRLGQSRSRWKWLLQRRSPGPEAGSRLCLKVRTFGLRPSCNSCLKRATLGNLHVCGGALETRAWRMICCRLGPLLKRVLSGAVLACWLCSRRDFMLRCHSMERNMPRAEATWEPTAAIELLNTVRGREVRYCIRCIVHC